MSVTFKVPASPKKNIFAIDEFLGVDLTNSGANIDEVRSPNAPNMVRYVPGKVRKRTGYQTNVLFAPPTNVNRALETSATEQTFILPKEEGEQIYTTLYYFDDSYTTGTTLYLDFWYKCDKPWWDSLTVSRHDPTDEWTHYVATIQTTWNANRFYASQQGSPQEADAILYIKEFAVMTDKNSSYTWSKHPNLYYETANAAPIYGCHVLKTGTFDGNRVTNVNRALNTSSEWTSYSLTYGDDYTDIYVTADDLHRSGVNAKVEFDYSIENGRVTMYILEYQFYLYDTEGEETHQSMIIGSSPTAYKVRVKASDGNPVFKIKNCSIMYDKNNAYQWSAAPEDNGGIFHTEDLWLTGTRDYSLLDSHYAETEVQNDNVASYQAVFGDATTHVDTSARVTFDLTTDSEKPVSSIIVGVVDSNNGYVYSKTFTDIFADEHFDLFLTVPEGAYFKRIYVAYTVPNGEGYHCRTQVSNLHVYQTSMRSSFDISSKNYIYHVGDKMYFRAGNSENFELIYNNANQHLSKSFQLNDKIYILDGKSIYSYSTDNESVVPIDDGNGYIPLVTFAKEPSGGGTPLDALNLLQPAFYEQFAVTADTETETAFHLSFRGLDPTPVKVWLLNQFGNWEQKIENTDFTVDRANGIINFTTAPGQSPLKGEDNVKVLAYRTINGYADRINKCTIGALFGVGGASDRLFLTGNPDYPNYDFYSEMNDASYFPDTGYAVLGSSKSAVVGYAIINNYLAAFKDEYDDSQSVFIREGDMISDEETKVSKPAFKLINTLQGNGVIAPYSFGYLQTEPLFLTRSGVYAITVQDITGEKYSQSRSFYIDGQLKKESNLENAFAVVFNDQYILAINNKLYILDGLQPVRTDRSAPYSTRQYAAFLCTDVPALCLWTDEQALWFGTNDGRVCRFANDIEDLESYNDDGKAIYSCWDTPDLDGKLFYKNKTFRYFAIRLMKALRTSARLYSNKLGTWTFIKEDASSGILFDFENINFELFSFSTDSSEKVSHAKLRVKKVDKARFRVENGKLNEPFGLFDLALEYIESGNYKG